MWKSVGAIASRWRLASSGCRIAIVSPNDNAVSSSAGTLLPANWIDVFRCSPGQRVSAISNDAGTFSLSITELTDWWRQGHRWKERKGSLLGSNQASTIDQIK
jgi:hypothetical protein